MSRNVLKQLGLIRVAFVAAVGLPLIIALSAHAQNAANPSNPAPGPATAPPTGQGPAAAAAAPAGGAAPAGAQAEAERVIVTGSNIPTAEEVGPNPVLNLNRDVINKSGERNAEQLIRDLPIANANGIAA